MPNDNNNSFLLVSLLGAGAVAAIMFAGGNQAPEVPALPIGPPPDPTNPTDNTPLIPLHPPVAPPPPPPPPDNPTDKLKQSLAWKLANRISANYPYNDRSAVETRITREIADTEDGLRDGSMSVENKDLSPPYVLYTISFSDLTVLRVYFYPNNGDMTIDAMLLNPDHSINMVLQYDKLHKLKTIYYPSTLTPAEAMNILKRSDAYRYAEYIRSRGPYTSLADARQKLHDYTRIFHGDATTTQVNPITIKVVSWFNETVSVPGKGTKDYDMKVESTVFEGDYSEPFSITIDLSLLNSQEQVLLSIRFDKLTNPIPIRIIPPTPQQRLQQSKAFKAGSRFANEIDGFYSSNNRDGIFARLQHIVQQENDGVAGIERKIAPYGETWIANLRRTLGEEPSILQVDIDLYSFGAQYRIWCYFEATPSVWLTIKDKNFSADPISELGKRVCRALEIRVKTYSAINYITWYQVFQEEAQKENGSSWIVSSGEFFGTKRLPFVAEANFRDGTYARIYLGSRGNDDAGRFVFSWKKKSEDPWVIFYEGAI